MRIAPCMSSLSIISVSRLGFLLSLSFISIVSDIFLYVPFVGEYAGSSSWCNGCIRRLLSPLPDETRTGKGQYLDGFKKLSTESSPQPKLSLLVVVVWLCQGYRAAGADLTPLSSQQAYYGMSPNPPQYSPTGYQQPYSPPPGQPYMPVGSYNFGAYPPSYAYR